MEANEHMLMLLMLAKLQNRIDGLYEALKANNIIAQDDPELHFRFVAEEKPQELLESMKSDYDSYLATAKSLGVVTGLKPRQTPQT